MNKIIFSINGILIPVNKDNEIHNFEIAVL